MKPTRRQHEADILRSCDMDLRYTINNFKFAIYELETTSCILDSYILTYGLE